MHESLILSKNLVFFCLLLGFLYSLLLYFRQHNFLNKKLLFLLSLSRFLLISFLAFLLLDPIVKSSKEIKEKPVVVILQDVSSSINKNITYKSTITKAAVLEQFCKWETTIKPYYFYPIHIITLLSFHEKIKPITFYYVVGLEHVSTS